MDSALNRQSGLLGVSGISADMREVEKAARGGNQDAALALAIYVHRVRQAVGALAATLGGVDALVFTAGVGEHAAAIRAGVCDRLQCLGLELDGAANAAARPDVDVASPGSAGRTRCWVKAECSGRSCCCRMDSGRWIRVTERARRRSLDGYEPHAHRSWCIDGLTCRRKPAGCVNDSKDHNIVAALIQREQKRPRGIDAEVPRYLSLGRDVLQKGQRALRADGKDRDGIVPAI